MTAIFIALGMSFGTLDRIVTNNINLYFAWSAAITGMTALWWEYRSLITSIWTSTIGKWIFGLVALALTNFALAYADMAIFEVTGHAPSLFPRAQSILAILLSLPTWMFVAYFVLTAVFLVQGLAIFLILLAQNDRFYKSALYRFMARFHRKHKRPSEWDFLRAVVSFASLLIVIGLMAKSLSSTTEETFVKNVAKRVIVFSSFFENNGRCYSIGDKTLMMPIRENAAMVLTDDRRYPITQC
jgi:hypothetical protein